MLKAHVVNVEFKRCICLLCEEVFLVKDDELNVQCPKCKNKNLETLSFETQEDDEKDSYGS